MAVKSGLEKILLKILNAQSQVSNLIVPVLFFSLVTVSQCTTTDQEPTTIQWSINLRTRSAWGRCPCPPSTAAACPVALKAETEMGLEDPAEREVRPTASEASRPTRGPCIPLMCIWTTWTHPDQCRQSVIFPEMNSVMEVEGLRDVDLCLINKLVVLFWSRACSYGP